MDRANTDRGEPRRDEQAEQGERHADAGQQGEERESRALPQDGSTKVHGDKLEELIPRDGGNGSTAGA